MGVSDVRSVQARLKTLPIMIAAGALTLAGLSSWHKKQGLLAAADKKRKPVKGRR